MQGRFQHQIGPDITAAAANAGKGATDLNGPQQGKMDQTRGSIGPRHVGDIVEPPGLRCHSDTRCVEGGLGHRFLDDDL